MKLLPFFLLFLLIAGCTSTPQTSLYHLQDETKLRYFQEGTHVQCLPNGVRPSRIVRTLFTCDFKQSQTSWETNYTNLENRLNFYRGWKEGTYGLVITKKPGIAQKDTAFELVSKSFEVKGNTSFSFQITAKSSENVQNIFGFDGMYLNAIEWIRADGTLAGVSPFRIVAPVNAMKTTVTTGRIPADAVRGVIHVALDDPDIPEEGYFVLAKVILEQEEEQGHHWPVASFISTPFLLPKSGRIRWDATVPSGCTIAIQLSTAPDDGGTPGLWNGFWGPGNNTNSAFIDNNCKLPKFSPGHVWGRYKVTMTSVGTSAPTLHAVSIGNVVHAKWVGPDNVPPDVRCITPVLDTADSPIIFELKDNSLLLWDTVQMKVDGVDVSAMLTRTGKRLIYTPNSPLEGQDGGVNLHFVQLIARDISGNEVDIISPVCVERSLVRNAVYVRYNGSLLVEQSLFMPMGVYGISVENAPERLQELKAMGINTVVTSDYMRTEAYYQMLRAAESLRIQMICPTPRGFAVENPQNVLRAVLKEKRSPGMLGWYLADRSHAQYTSTKLTDISRMIHALDPNHLTVQSDAFSTLNPLQLYAYINATQAFMPRLSSEYERLLRELALLQKSRRLTRKPVSIWPRIPCKDQMNWFELRCASYLPLIYGMNGLIWEVEGDSWGKLKGIATEINEMRPILMDIEQINPCRIRNLQGNTQIQSMYRIHKKKAYLICVNPGFEPAEVEITNIRNIIEAKVRFEDRTVRVSEEGGMKDFFKPFEVHVYEFVAKTKK